MTDQKDNRTSGQPLLTLAMIVRNGGQLFASLLEGAARYVDEIVVGDTGSKDASPRTARQAGAILHRIPWTDDFAAARNAVLAACTGRWILILDADEQLADQDWARLREWLVVHDPRQEPVAISLVTRNYLPGRFFRRGWQPNPDPDPHALPSGPPAPGFVPSAKVRVVPNRPEIRFAGHLHETMETSLRNAGIPVVSLSLPVHHFGMLPEHQSEQDQQDKAQQYLKLARRKASSNPHLPTAWAELADCATACGNLELALQAVNRALILAPLNADYRLTAGWLLKEMGRLEEADRQLSAATAGEPVSETILAEISHLRGQIALLGGRTGQAGSFLNLALRLAPDNSHYLNTLGAWHLREGRGEQARQVLEKAHQLQPEATEPLLNLGLLYTAADLPEQAERVYRKALDLDPGCTKAAEALARLEQDALEPVT